jgi:hypothetical protein
METGSFFQMVTALSAIVPVFIAAVFWGAALKKM